MKDRSFTRTLVLLCYPGLCIICVVAMSRKENLISELHTRKGTWKIVVRITNLWEVRKQNSKQAIKMVLMDQMVIVVFFLLVVISNFYCMWCDFILWFRCFRVQRLVLLSGKNCSLSFGTSYIVVLRIWFRTRGLLTVNLNTESAQFHFWFISLELHLSRRSSIQKFLLMSTWLLCLLI